MDYFFFLPVTQILLSSLTFCVFKQLFDVSRKTTYLASSCHYRIW